MFNREEFIKKVYSGKKNISATLSKEILKRRSSIPYQLVELCRYNIQDSEHNKVKEVSLTIIKLVSRERPDIVYPYLEYLSFSLFESFVSLRRLTSDIISNCSKVVKYPDYSIILNNTKEAIATEEDNYTIHRIFEFLNEAIQLDKDSQEETLMHLLDVLYKSENYKMDIILDFIYNSLHYLHRDIQRRIISQLSLRK